MSSVSDTALATVMRAINATPTMRRRDSSLEMRRCPRRQRHLDWASAHHSFDQRTDVEAWSGGRRAEFDMLARSKRLTDGLTSPTTLAIADATALRAEEMPRASVALRNSAMARLRKSRKRQVNRHLQMMPEK
jgi:hypothetical protein